VLNQNFFTGWVEDPLRTADAVRVPRKPIVPHALRRSPFTLAEARAAGVTPNALRGDAWRRIGPELYCWKHWGEDKWALLSSWRRVLPQSAAFSGRTAAAIHGLDFDPANPVEIMLAKESSVRTSFGLAVRHCDVPVDDLVTVRGLRTTSLPRTLRDLCVQWPAGEALVAFDMALKLGLADVVGLWRYAQDSVGRPGAARMRHLAQFAEPAESPMETRLRWLLIEAGVPRPEVQTDLHDRQGQFVGRADLYFPHARLVLEFDGGNHRERLVSDDRRQNEIINAGFAVLRFTSADLRTRSDVVIAQVRSALTESARLVHTARNDERGRALLVQNER
jgi:very-short-patch-repair endonuclease